MELFFKTCMLVFCLLQAVSLHQVSAITRRSNMERRLILLENKFNIQTYEMSLLRDELNQMKDSKTNRDNITTEPSSEEESSPETDTSFDNEHWKTEAEKRQAMFDTIMKAFKQEKAIRLELEQKVERDQIERKKLEENIVQQRLSYKQLLENYGELSVMVQQQQETIKMVANDSAVNDLRVALGALEKTCESQAVDTMTECEALTSANEQLFRNGNANTTKVLKQLQNISSILQTSLTALEQNKIKTRVSFSARVAGNIANVGPWKTVVFNQVITNDGGAYSGSSGEFRAPIDGVYVFFAHVMGTHRKALEMALQVNGGNIMWLYANGLGHGRDANMVVVRLKAGDKVKVVKHGSWGASPFYVHASWSTFSGFLLY